MKTVDNNKTAIIILHEIYGVNQFIEGVCSQYTGKGYHVFCPNMLGRGFFPYSEAQEAYEFFIEKVGFDYFKEVESFALQLRQTYESVFLLGFSVGATIAWRCCENGAFDGIICCYGSRIRDYLSLQPSCPILLLFAEEDKFDVGDVIDQLAGKNHLELYKFDAKHGFMDSHSKYYNREQKQLAEDYISIFLRKYH
ncbi:dienelactone hydrolase family protein [Anaerotignum sp. MB30-C6]|uniref:dienelactone hydrolase family protein n=1 Tax=Anaerotignum sp. MB30-C6 TaxID=3070814 RepID=UPI0027DC00BE|nr:dienelactone hydrolase family protein [Anaerotignum sp. MB30-C6]WMI79896.1 dienelactone hydrolase family protein [Anaerotignum sp. MB30-C6]